MDGTINGQPFQATLEPDGQLRHWLKVDRRLLKAANADVGEVVHLEIVPVEKEPEPRVPADLERALAASPKARKVWENTTTIARLDWIHWIESSKQSKTRKQRIDDASEMLASGKRRVCCFDPSGFYSKSFSAPEATD